MTLEGAATHPRSKRGPPALVKKQLQETLCLHEERFEEFLTSAAIWRERRGLLFLVLTEEATK